MRGRGLYPLRVRPDWLRRVGSSPTAPTNLFEPQRVTSVVRIAFMSDLHWELWPTPKRRAVADRGPVPAPFGPHGPSLKGLRERCDVLVIAGDFDVGPRGASALIAASHYLDVSVIYVPGNHEFYGHKVYKVLRELRLALEGTRVHLLNRSELIMVVRGRAVRFLGTTLWTDFAVHGEERIGRCLAAAYIGKNDYRRITVGPDDTGYANWRRLLPRDTLEFHHRDRKWLRDRLRQSFAGPTVVVTHMAPSIRSVPPEDAAEPIGATNASDLEGFIEETKPYLWIHGHTHMSSDYVIGRTRVICNPYGYWGEELNKAFESDRVIDLEDFPRREI